MKLVMIITGLSTGGAEMMLFKLLQHIDQQKFSPHVISLTNKGEMGKQIEKLGVPLEVLGMKANRIEMRKIIFLIKRLRTLCPDVIHTWMYHSDLIGGIAARLAGFSNVGWCIRNSDLSKNTSKRSTRLVMKTCAFVSYMIPQQILCCSEVARKIHIDAGYKQEKMVILPNGFDLKLFQRDLEAKRKIRIELGVSPNTQLVGHIARYNPQKNHMGFLKAASLVHKELPDVHFVMAGSRVDQSNIELGNETKRLGIDSVVHLLGRREDIPCLMASLDVLVSSSSYGEAFPNVLGEAMACGIPCVVTDVGDSVEIVGDTGQVASPENMRELADGILKILSLSTIEWSQLSKKTRDRVKEKYDIKKVVKQYEHFYESFIRIC